jgi:hypothetical protein
MEITMRKFTVLVVPLIAALTAQAAAASDHYTRAKGHAAASAQWRNSNAYAAPADIAVHSSYWTNLDNGMMASGAAGH